MQQSFWTVVGLCPKKKETRALQGHRNLSECFLCQILAEVCPQSTVKNNFLFSFSSLHVSSVEKDLASIDGLSNLAEFRTFAKTFNHFLWTAEIQLEPTQ